MLLITKREKKTLFLKKNLLRLFLFITALFFFLCILFFFIPFIASLLPIFFHQFKLLKLDIVENNFYALIRIFVFTVSQSFFSSLLALFIGMLSAFFCANREFKGRKILMSLSAIPLTLPAIIMALSYILFFGNNGLFYTLLKNMLGLKINSFLYSFSGIIIAQGMYNFPIAMRLITESWQKIPQNEKDSSTLLGASSFMTFKMIIFPYLVPSIMSSFLLIFLFCFFSFVIILLFGGVGTSTIEVELYKCINYSFNIKLASTLSLIEVLFSLCLLNFYLYFKKKSTINTNEIELEINRLKIHGMIEKFIFYLLISVILLFLIMPITSILLYSFYSQQYSYSSLYSFTIRAWQNIFSLKSFYVALFNSISVALLVALISVFATLFFSYMKLFFKMPRYFELLSFLPLISSSIMLGFGWNVILKQGTVFTLIFCQSALFWFFAYAQFQLYIIRIPKSIIDSSILLSKSNIFVFFKTILPLSYKGLVSGAIFVFAMSMSDASLPLILSIENFENLSLMLFSFASSYRFSQSATIAIILILASSIAFWVKDIKDS